MYDFNKTIKEVFKNMDEIEKIKNCNPAEHKKTIEKKDKK